ncbi:FAD-binding oxidoreductase, partial [Rhodobacterales bacterium]
AYPRDEADLVRIATLLDDPRFHDVVIRPRGGGTGTNGQSLGEGLVVDTSRYMCSILEINAEERWVRVQPGVIKDQLNEALAPHGLFFAPELSTSSRATIGGMISTDACGQGSCAYGKTSNHVLALRTALMGGEVLETGRQTYSPSDSPADGRIGEVLEVLDRISREQADLIRDRFPKLNRALTGYDLANIRKDETIDPAAVLCGSEGTLGLISEARLNVLPIPKSALLLLIFYDGFQDALKDAGNLAALGATSVETIDSKVLALARQEASFPAVEHLFPDPASAGVNIVEFTGDDPDTLLQEVRAHKELLDRGSNRRVSTLASGPEVKRVWNLRKASVGLLGRSTTETRPVAFVEDCAVPPESLEPFIREFRELLDGENLDYGMFGHVDAGVLHVRPALDLTDPEQETIVRRVTEQVAALARRYGGLLWGEHGKGVRSEFVPEVFGPLYPSLQAIKAAFDPRNQFNPGKIATPGAEPLTRIDDIDLRGQFDRQVDPSVRQTFAPAFGCNGNGACFNRAANDVMCPSYKQTLDRRHSPKGRASLLREWLRQDGLEGRADPVLEGEVKQAMDGCLSCSACASQCPIHVDIPHMKALFLDSYFKRHKRGLRDHLLNHLEGLLPLVRKAPTLYNLMVQGPGEALLHRVGLTALPTVRQEGTKPLPVLRRADVATLDAARDVVLVPDAFTHVFEPQIAEDLGAVLSALGRRLLIAPYRPSGKARKVLGRMRGFARQADKQSELLREIAATGVKMVGIEPAVVLSYRRDYPEGTPEVLLVQDLLAQLVEQDQSPLNTGNLH